MTEPPAKASDLDLSDDTAAPDEPAGLTEWEHGFIDAYLYLHHVHDEPTHEELNRAVHALEHFIHTHQPRAGAARNY
jgi:hypothetical protein